LAGILAKRKSLNRYISEYRQANDSLKRELIRLQNLANIGVISAMAAHEMNNILTPVSSYAQLASKHPDDKKLISKMIQKTLTNTQQAAKILETMLKIAAGNTSEKQICSLADLIDETFLLMARDLSKDGITVNIDVGDVSVLADRICFEQLLMNLIINARDAMLQTGGILTITAEKHAGTAKIKISDTGKGIPPQHIDKIFEPFFTTKAHDSCSLSGTGLGLAFCKRIIEEHNGSISVESTLGKGTTFTVLVPSGD